MKWVVVALILCLATFCRGGALKCTPGSKAKACITENKEKDTAKLEDVLLNREAECLPGSEWESNCHKCRCSDAGMAVCSRLETCKKTYGEPIRCKPKTSFKRDCNTCRCLENGLGLCTQKGCLSSTFPIDPVVEEKKSDEVGPESHHNLLKRSTVCIPGSKYIIECNTCLCSTDGQSFTCTLLACFVGDVNNDDVELFKDDEERISKEQSDESEVNACKPRSTFNVGCNTCLCNIDGSNYSCTNKPCPLPDDVEIFHELKEKKRIVP